jgi:hypothetical protein
MRTRSAALISRYSTIESVAKVRLRWVSITPLASPVEPEGCIIAAKIRPHSEGPQSRVPSPSAGEKIVD